MSHTKRGVSRWVARMQCESKRFRESITPSATATELLLAELAFEAGFLAGIRNVQDARSDETSNERTTP